MVNRLLFAGVCLWVSVGWYMGAFAQSPQPSGRAPNTGDPALLKPSPYSLRIQDGALQPSSNGGGSAYSDTTNSAAAGLPPAPLPMQSLPAPPSGASFRRPSNASESPTNVSNTQLPSADNSLSNGTLNPPQTVTARPLASPATNTSSSEVQTASFSTPSTSRSASPLQGMELRAPSKGNAGGLTKPNSTLGTLFSLFFSLAIVLGLFLAAAWFLKKAQPKGFSRLPNEVVQVLGRTNLAPRQQMYVIRFGKKLLLVSQQAGHTQTLSEIDEDVEVERLAGVCEASQPSSISQTFSEVLRNVASGKEKIPAMPRKLRKAI